MEASAVAILPIFFVSRDEKLHQRACQRAVGYSVNNKTKQWFDLTMPETFKLSIDLSGIRVSQERLSRERILQLQEELNK